MLKCYYCYTPYLEDPSDNTLGFPQCECEAEADRADDLKERAEDARVEAALDLWRGCDE